MSDISMVPESTLPDTSSELRERELELRERAEVQVPATQAVRVTPRLEDEVHDIRDDVRRLATRFDGLEERFDGLEQRFDGLEQRFDGLEQRMDERDRKIDGRLDESDRRIDGRFDTIKVWTDGMNKWTVEVAETLRTIMAQLAELKKGAGPAE